MTKRIRRLIFWSLVAIFLLIAPAFSLYALGYFFDSQEFKIIKTGSLYLSSIPKNSQILVDGETIKKTPALIKRLKPGQHQVTLTKDGFKTWQKTLMVYPSQVTEARNVLLVPENPPMILQAGIKNFNQLPFQEQLEEKEIFAQNFLKDSGIIFSALAVGKDNFYFLKEPGLTLFAKNFFSQQPPQQISITNLADCHCDAQQPFLAVSPKEKIALITPNDQLYILNENREFKLLHENVQRIAFSGDGNKLLFLSNNEIWVYYLSPSVEQPLHQAEDKVFLTRFSSPIVAIAWYLNNQNIVFATAEQIKITEIDERDSRNIFDLISLPEAEFLTDFADKKFYLKSADKIFEMEIEKKETFL